ncbi:MAG: dihydrofolate reductase [Cyclobacteriaceae bacterium]|nr:dihydrofolate reductase [Cyclobacteriaceae bacterium]
MRKIVLGVAISLDGFIEGPHGEYDWCFSDQDYGMSDFFKRIDALIIGRKSWEIAQQYDGPSPWKGTTTYVFSNTLKSVNDEHTVILSGDVSEEVGKLRNTPGKDIWLFGGAELTTSFINHRLLDELWLSVHPIILGSGKPLFQLIDGRKILNLLESKSYDTGLVSLRYAMKK